MHLQADTSCSCGLETCDLDGLRSLDESLVAVVFFLIAKFITVGHLFLFRHAHTDICIYIYIYNIYNKHMRFGSMILQRTK